MDETPKSPFQRPEWHSDRQKGELFEEGNIADLKDDFDIVIETEHDIEHGR